MADSSSTPRASCGFDLWFNRVFKLVLMAFMVMVAYGIIQVVLIAKSIERQVETTTAEVRALTAQVEELGDRYEAWKGEMKNTLKLEALQEFLDNPFDWKQWFNADNKGTTEKAPHKDKQP